MRKKYFKIFSCCLVVEGASNSIICDLQRGTIQKIPLEIGSLLQESKTQTIQNFIETFSDHNPDKIWTFFDSLVERELGFYTDFPESFPDIEIFHETPRIIENAVIEIDRSLELQIYNRMFCELSELGCLGVEIRFLCKMDFEFVAFILDKIKNSRIGSIELVLKNDGNDNFFELVYEKLIKCYYRINSVIVYNSQEQFIDNTKRQSSIIAIKDSEYFNIHCGSIHLNFFRVNKELFFESKLFNNCLNKKVSINKNGEIKNCLSMISSYGNIVENTIREALDNPEFRKYWNINKDQIEVCKDCEFRYICTDCRAYVEEPENIYSKPLKCGYDPYTGKWEEWSKNPLKQKAIEYYGMEEIIKE
ncbi:MAG: grasp-with-spasm system SPASM domain peptide maturase [Saprospiraceae bacterium]